MGVSFALHIHGMRCDRDQAGPRQSPSSANTSRYRGSPLRRRSLAVSSLFGAKNRIRGASEQTEKVSSRARHTEMVTWSLEPQPDGTLRGVATDTVLTNECGSEGAVSQVPFVATRVGDVPPSVTVADPATVPAAPATSSPIPAVAGVTPVLDGTYRLDYDMANQTADGVPVTSPGPNVTHWLAIRSLCTSAGCVATGAAMADTNHQEAVVGGGIVLRFVDGHWQTTPGF